jgi:hypothetical protein
LEDISLATSKIKKQKEITRNNSQILKSQKSKIENKSDYKNREE